MKFATKTLAATVLGVVLAGSGIAAFAGNYGDKDHDGNEQHEQISPELMAQVTVTAQQAIATALSTVPGTVIESELEQEDGQLVWEVEVLDANQQTRELEIDAKTGSILKNELDD